MKSRRDLLVQPHLTLISDQPDPELGCIGEIVVNAMRVGGRLQLEELFGYLLDGGPEITLVPKTLDLLGHSTPAGLLALGDWVIDGTSPRVTAFFRGLADQDVLPRLGIHAMRLLACKTADSEIGRQTICTLSDILGLEVYGTTHLLYDAQYDANGFRDTWRFLLTGASDLRREADDSALPQIGDPYRRVLDIDALPAAPLGPRPTAWPRRIASPHAAREILQLVRRDEGARMAGLLAQPTSELALPSVRAGAYHVAHVLLDGEFMRFYPDGSAAPGVLYPVDDRNALRRVVAALPAH